MKIKVLFLFTLFILIIVFLLSMNIVYACMTPLDDYGVEVVLNKEGVSYDLEKINNIKNIIKTGNEYILGAQANSNIAVILEKIGDVVKGLSIRLQIPVVAVDKKISYTRLISSSATGDLEITPETKKELELENWKIECTDDQPISKCVFEKKDKEKELFISVDRVSKGKYSVYVEIKNTELSDCKPCDGKCLYAGGKATCLPKELVKEIENIIKKINIIKNFNDFTRKIRLERGVNEIRDLEPENQLFGQMLKNINWQEALRQELVWLNNNKIIDLERDDIEKISSLAKLGQAGQNKRIVYDKDKNDAEKWLYYDETSLPILKKVPNCNEFSISLLPTGAAVVEKKLKLSTYYIIPIVITLFIFIIFLILLIIVRFSNLRS